MTDRKIAWRRIAALVVIGAIVLNGSLAVAQSYDPDQSIPKPTLLEKRLNKLGRGISNILFGWAEIPKTMDEKYKAGKPLAYLIGAAPVLGTARALMRTGTGVVEVFTFAKTKPERNYEAILKPDYIF